MLKILVTFKVFTMFDNKKLDLRKLKRKSKTSTNTIKLQFSKLHMVTKQAVPVPNEHLIS